MHFVRLATTERPEYDKALALYRESFPYHEQREARSQDDILSDEEYRFELVYDKDIFAGLLLCWETDAFVYVEHFCIFPELRGRSYGSQTLHLLAQCGKTIILELDPPVDEVSRRRKGFYERAGFTANAFHHVHPPYHAQNAGHELVVMSCPNALTEEEYARFSSYLENTVMKNAY